MNHPHGPSGDGSPGQQPRPGFATYHFPEPVPQPPPSGVTGIMAVAFAGLVAVACLGVSLLAFLGLIGVSLLDTDSRVQTSVGISGSVLPVLILGILLTFVAGLLLAAGTVKLAQRKMAGRRLVVGGCGVTIAANLLSLGYAASATGPYISGGTFALLGLIFPMATLVLVLVPSTTAWITAKRKSTGAY